MAANPESPALVPPSERTSGLAPRALVEEGAGLWDEIAGLWDEITCLERRFRDA